MPNLESFSQNTHWMIQDFCLVIAATPFFLSLLNNRESLRISSAFFTEIHFMPFSHFAHLQVLKWMFSFAVLEQYAKFWDRTYYHYQNSSYSELNACCKKLTVSPKFFKNSKIILNNIQITTYGRTRWQKKITKLMTRIFYRECTHSFLHVTIVQLNLVLKQYY